LLLRVVEGGGWGKGIQKVKEGMLGDGGGFSHRRVKVMGHETQLAGGGMKG
jgi:hypothetical protein